MKVELVPPIKPNVLITLTAQEAVYLGHILLFFRREALRNQNEYAFAQDLLTSLTATNV